MSTQKSWLKIFKQKLLNWFVHQKYVLYYENKLKQGYAAWIKSWRGVCRMQTIGKFPYKIRGQIRFKETISSLQESDTLAYRISTFGNAKTFNSDVAPEWTWRIILVQHRY
jgi:hypothetical protein